MKKEYVIPGIIQQAEVRLEENLLQKSIVVDEMSVEVTEYEDVTFDSDHYFDAEFK